MFKKRLDILKEILSFWVNDKEFVEHVQLSSTEGQYYDQVQGEDVEQPEESGEQPEVVTEESAEWPEVVTEESGEWSEVVTEESGEHSGDITDNLEVVTFGPKSQKRGQLKGSCTTAIGRPRQKRQKVTGKP